MIEISEFGKLSTGQTVHKYTITNKKKEYVELLDFGAAIHGIHVLDKKDRISDVVLGVSEATELEKYSFEGITIGRCANRIEYGKCLLDGKEIQLECNMFGHFLHGASGNYGCKMFEAKVVQDENKVIFSLLDTGEGGFDTNVDVKVEFTFDNQSRLWIQYIMIPDGITILSPTNHTYFNLSGKDVRDHLLKINSDRAAKRSDTGVPCGGTISVIGTPADFSEEKSIREAMDSDTGNYFSKEQKRFDEIYILPDEYEGSAAKLTDLESGRCLEVYTDMQSLIIFNGIAEGKVKGKEGTFYEGYCGFCLETQFVPNAVNCSDYKSPVYKKDEVYRSTTIYQFSVEK